jgi:four helix bundle protein
MTANEMKLRTKHYALRVIKAVDALPKSRAGYVLGSQLLRSGTSVGANYRAACRAKSSADFLHKLKIVEEECDESIYWMELMIDSGLLAGKKLAPLMNEGDEILSIVVASLRTTRQNLAARKSPTASMRDSKIINRAS